MPQSDLIAPAEALIRRIKTAPLIGADITVGGQGSATGLVINVRGAPGVRTVGMSITVDPEKYANEVPVALAELEALIGAAKAGKATEAQSRSVLQRAVDLGNAALKGAITGLAEGIALAFLE